MKGLSGFLGISRDSSDILQITYMKKGCFFPEESEVPVCYSFKGDLVPLVLPVGKLG